MSHKLLKELYTDLFKWMPDRAYISMSYLIKTHSFMHWSNPVSFSEKLQWLKVNNRNPIYSKLVDKYEVKEFISETIGQQYAIPTLAVWNNVEEIDFNLLPQAFVLKCTHDSGSVIICKNKEFFDYEQAKKKLNHHLKRNLYYLSREWPYKNVIPRIIAEPLLQTEDGTPISDYKIFCFNGEPKIVYVTFGRGSEEKMKINYYDLSWNKLNLRHLNYDNYQGSFTPPESFANMLYLARELSKGFTFIRIDFYDIDGKIYVGEMTFYPDGGWGFHKSTPRSMDIQLGNMIDIPKIKQ